MDDVIERATDPIVNYAFGGFCCLLLVALGCFLKWWRSDAKEAIIQYANLSHQTTEAITKNADANVKLSHSLDKLAQHQDELNRRLLSRPCLKNGVNPK